MREAFQCQEDVAHSIAGVAVERAYRTGAVILRRDDPCAETYLLTLGRVRAAAVGSGRRTGPAARPVARRPVWRDGPAGDEERSRDRDAGGGSRGRVRGPGFPLG
ncbi:hypothetical protein ACRAWD_10350 [Caulobacter segnis]